MEKLSEIKIIVYTVSDVSKLLNVSEDNVRRWIKSETLKAMYTGSKKTGYLIFDDDLQNFMDKNQKYRERYKIVLAANEQIGILDVKETDIRDFILGYLYGRVSYECFRHIDKTLSITPSICQAISMMFNKLIYNEEMTKEDIDIVSYAIEKGYEKIKTK